ncbi:MAG TPA: quinohemoprotein amine dehydrogenase subunit alpha [Longimicrobiales bacterium]|nr:quinohemoprotein amine dehydrogenase subunit alpha [Longimicrobiales bacterium]
MGLLRQTFRWASGLLALGVLLGWSPAQEVTRGAGQSADPEQGFAVASRLVVDRCSRCHVAEEEGRLSRISYLRKTPEGWQTSIRRMVALHGVRLTQEEAREIVRYLAGEQGLAPEELRPGLFEVERRMMDYDYPGDSGVEFTCIQCHSMGRVITQRRTEEEWGLLLATHRALYPLVDFQAFRRPGRAPEEGDARHPMEVAIDHLSETFPLRTPEWSAWSATKRAPRLAGTWALSGYEPGKGPIYGTVTVEADRSDPEAFTTSAEYVYAESGERVRRSGEALVYTGYQWRGRSNAGSETELREVMFVERDQSEMTGRWFTGDYDEIGSDVTLRRASGPILTGVHPRALERGAAAEVRIYGDALPAGAAPGDLDFGAGVSVTSIEDSSEGGLRVRLSIDDDAPIGARDAFAFGSSLPEALVVHDGVDRIEVMPRAGMARVGGANFPKAYQTFEAIGFDDGRDGEAGTEDDLDLGRVDASWRLEEYAATYGDDDVEFVGTLRQDGVFVPAEDGPNPNRSGNRNNIGDVWVVATHRSGADELTARAQLIVTVPLYMRFDPWRPVGEDRPVSEEQ